jgi:hypothetical protein
VRGVPATPAEGCVLIVVLVCFFVSSLARIRLFRKYSADPELRKLLGDASIIGRDLLAFRLARHWNRLSKDIRRACSYFVIPWLIAFFGILGIGASVFFRT